MINLKKVSKIYPPASTVLADINLEVAPGEFVSVVGKSGAGKSTLVKLLIAEEHANEGRVVIGDWDITAIKRRDVPILRRQIGVVFQDFKLLPQKTAWENVSFALEVIGASRKHIEMIVPAVLSIVGLETRQNAFPRELSGGEQQRVSLARALAHRPKILLADEPTGNLDMIHTKDIIDLLLKINELGTTVLLVTHNREVVNRIRKRVVVLEEGKVVSDQERGRYAL